MISYGICSASDSAVHQPDPEDDDPAAQQRRRRHRFTQDEKGDDHGDQRLETQKYARLGRCQGLQGIVPRNVCQARAEDSQKGDRQPAIRREAANRRKGLACEVQDRCEQPAERHQVQNH